MSTEIQSGGLTVKDPNAIEFFVVDWDQLNLAAGVEIASSEWEIAGRDAVLTKDQPSVLGGNRKTRIRLSAGTLGQKYTVTNRITTNESPSQAKDASFYVLIQQK